MATAVLPDDLDGLLDQLSSVRGVAREVTPLDGGLTNVNVRVRTPDVDVVVRISRENSMLAIDRHAEYLNSRAAASSGASPAVVEYVPTHHLLVIDYVDGTTLTPAEVRDGSNLPRLAAACRLLHSGPRFVGEFDMFEVQRRYLETVRAAGFRLPDRYLDFMSQVEQIARALSAVPVPTVPCNNDLLAANFIDDGDRIWIIDFEYAGNNDPCFELGNIWSESNLAVDQLDELITHYFGREWPCMVARARLLGLMSKYGWTLWASIQDASSDIDFDFWEWGMEKYDRAVDEFESPDFESLLAAAAAPD